MHTIFSPFGPETRLFMLTVALASAAATSPAYADDDSQVFSPSMPGYSTVNPAFPALAKIRTAQKAHRVLVGVIDTGVQYGHPALAANMHYNLTELEGFASDPKLGLDRDGNGLSDDYLGYDFEGQDGYPSYRVGYVENGRIVRDEDREGTSDLGHGTHVTGIVVGTGAAKNPAIGIVPFRLAMKFDGAVEDSARIEQALRVGRAQGARVFNLSLGWPAENESGLLKAMARLQSKLATEFSDVVVVVSAGNSGIDTTGAKVVQVGDQSVLVGAIEYPGNLRASNKLTVGSVTPAGKISDGFTSSDGEGDESGVGGSNYGRYVDVYALGDDIRSTVPNDHENPGNGYGRLSGTSQAAPAVTNLAARLLLKKPCLKAAEVVRIIKGMAQERQVKQPNGKLATIRIMDAAASLERAESFACTP